MSRLRVAVLFGGASSEYEISLMSATSVLKNMSDAYDVILLGITKDGRWYRFDGDISLIEQDKWSDPQYSTPAILSPDPHHSGILLLDGERYTKETVDVIFPVLHGKNGEDGTMQGLLELSGIPYVGCGVLSSAVCMDKEISHIILEHAGIRTAKWLTFRESDAHDMSAVEKTLVSAFGYPMFVKPANTGSSVGVSKVRSKDQLIEAFERAFQYDKKIIVEEAITGIELECAVLGNDDPIVSVPGQITPKREFYDYEAKYIEDSTELAIPAKIDELTTQLVKATAAKAYRALGSAGLTRMDFFVQQNGDIILNEPNTLPGFTKISMYPKLMEYSGIPYSLLIDKLIALALHDAKEDDTSIERGAGLNG